MAPNTESATESPTDSATELAAESVVSAARAVATAVRVFVVHAASGAEGCSPRGHDRPQQPGARCSEIEHAAPGRSTVLRVAAPGSEPGAAPGSEPGAANAAPGRCSGSIQCSGLLLRVGAALHSNSEQLELSCRAGCFASAMIEAPAPAPWQTGWRQRVGRWLADLADTPACICLQLLAILFIVCTFFYWFLINHPPPGPGLGRAQLG